MLNDLMRGHLYGSMEQEEMERRRRAALDSAREGAFDSASKFEMMATRMDAVAAIQEWADELDLDDGESASDRLLALMVGIADSNQDGELDEDEQEVVFSAMEAAWDYLSGLGVDDQDLDLLLNEWDADAAERVRELVSSALSESDDDMDGFVFGPEAQEAIFDATYRKKIAVRGGKKVRINKRVSGNVRLSGKQKLAIRKAQMKARSAGAKVRRMKSMRVRQKLGL
ncbi:hypothetical protein PU634_05135 [Oceanimonas pelagia]|uniref:Uncharacterized protein n=1 Tax=Oceanimonas pelagia TaxID=3028314 RepID=A0AA50QCY7_9GAMM|nr:hypothetical protein [Oceanimonas pelagia]WMC11752.1 hypothetical protein PU634_05135 [Oceanimonas pelagia]